jgi:hypothetical protein
MRVAEKLDWKGLSAAEVHTAVERFTVSLTNVLQLLACVKRIKR